jgi:hypothetical protein
MKIINYMLKDQKKLRYRKVKRGPPVNTVILDGMNLVDCCGEDGNLPLTTNEEGKKIFDRDQMRTNYFLNTVDDSDLQPGYVPPEE